MSRREQLEELINRLGDVERQLPTIHNMHLDRLVSLKQKRERLKREQEEVKIEEKVMEDRRMIERLKAEIIKMEERKAELQKSIQSCRESVPELEREAGEYGERARKLSDDRLKPLYEIEKVKRGEVEG